MELNLLTLSDYEFLKELKKSWLSETSALLNHNPKHSISLSEYDNALRKHDWYYDYSDCYKTRDAARRDMCMLEVIAKKHYVFDQQLKVFKKWAGVNFNRPCSMPEKPIRDLIILHDYIAKSEEINLREDLEAV